MVQCRLPLLLATMPRFWAVKLPTSFVLFCMLESCIGNCISCCIARRGVHACVAAIQRRTECSKAYACRYSLPQPIQGPCWVSVHHDHLSTKPVRLFARTSLPRQLHDDIEAVEKELTMHLPFCVISLACVVDL